MKDIKQRIQHQIQCLNDQVLSHSRLLEFIDFFSDKPNYILTEFTLGRREISNPTFWTDGTGISGVSEPCWFLRIYNIRTGITSLITYGVHNVQYETVLIAVNNKSGKVRGTYSAPVDLNFADLLQKFTEDNHV